MAFNIRINFSSYMQYLSANIFTRRNKNVFFNVTILAILRQRFLSGFGILTFKAQSKLEAHISTAFRFGTNFCFFNRKLIFHDPSSHYAGREWGSGWNNV